tara:strand:+ start:2294 stop:3061 length:768 start_codon:yes stop_codon:yes gene_type:complete
MINYIESEEHKAAIIEINRPDQLNALNNSVISAIDRELEEIRSNKNIRSVIIRGVGQKAFVAGADIKEFQKFNKEEARTLSITGKERLFDKISNFNKPVLACINGYALGGGLELALASHIRIASETAKLGLPECSLGIIPGYGGTQRLGRIVGVGKAMEMILTAQMIGALEAKEIGLVNQITDNENILLKSLEITKLFHRTSPESLSAAIKSINSCFYPGGSKVESEEFARLFETPNFQEGVNAFLEKRKPNFNK